MKNSVLLLGICIVGLVLIMNCSSNKKQFEPSQARRLSPSELSGYHNAINMRIGWMPYKNIEYEQTAANDWVLLESDTSKQGRVPVIIIAYPESGDSVWFSMNTKNETLGKLIKHTLMTQQPIYEPIDTYLADASCTKCHPSDVKVNFDW